MLMKHKQMNAFQSELSKDGSVGLDIRQLKHIETRFSQIGAAKVTAENKERVSNLKFEASFPRRSNTLKMYN